MRDLDEQLAQLATMSPAELRTQWRRALRSDPPRLSPDLLRRIIAYRLQERAHGGLSPARLRELRRMGAADSRATPKLKPGTRLVRGWQGRSVAVLVTEQGYMHDGRAYSSLSSIAREVTGTSWSGPRFFGLTQPDRVPRG